VPATASSQDKPQGGLSKTGSAEKNLSQLSRRSPEDEVYALAEELLVQFFLNFFCFGFFFCNKVYAQARELLVHFFLDFFCFGFVFL
jgi:hypothetical protein